MSHKATYAALAYTVGGVATVIQTVHNGANGKPAFAGWGDPGVAFGLLQTFALWPYAAAVNFGFVKQ